MQVAISRDQITCNIYSSEIFFVVIIFILGQIYTLQSTSNKFMGVPLKSEKHFHTIVHNEYKEPALFTRHCNFLLKKHENRNTCSKFPSLLGLLIAAWKE